MDLLLFGLQRKLQYHCFLRSMEGTGRDGKVEEE
jgi:hypothetical protein